MKWLRTLTYVAAGVCGVCAFIFPVAAPFLVPAATGLTGWASIHPSDAATPEALADLAQKAAVIALEAQAARNAAK
jgi:hypothetical protein